MEGKEQKWILSVAPEKIALSRVPQGSTFIQYLRV